MTYGPTVAASLAALPLPASARARGRTVRRQPGTMNKLEAAYAVHLDTLKAAGEVADWKFESIKLRLADRTWYTPDFCVMEPDGSLRFDETKGFLRDDAAVKLKVAAEQYPWFRFRLVKQRARKQGGGWDIKEIGA